VYEAIIWLIAIEVLGLLAFPISFLLFRRLPDRGYTLSKVFALLLVSYTWWLLGLTQLIPASRWTLIGIVVALAVVAVLLVRRQRVALLGFLRTGGGFIVVAELLFLGFYFGWLTFVSHSPEINHTEKPMDFAFLNAVLKSSSFPPEDPWLSGHSVSYYYFGHLTMAGLTKLTGIPSSIAYNLSIVLVAALVAQASYGLVYNLIRLSGARVRTAATYALAAPLFVGVVSNLEGVLEFIRSQGWGSSGFWQWVGVKGLDSPVSSSSFYPSQGGWWWRATRVIDTVVDGRSLDYTISEFPSFSFILGDLHAHVTSMPFLLLSLSLGLNLLLSPVRVGLGWLKRNPWEAFFIALSLGALGFINLIDLPVFALLLMGVLLVKSYGESGRVGHSLLSTLVMVLPLLVAALLLYLPFYATFNTQVSGILPVREVGTRPLHFFLVWGLFLVIAVSFLLVQARRLSWDRDRGLAILVIGIALAPFALWAAIEVFLSAYEEGVVSGLLAVGARFGKILPGLAFSGLALYSALRWSRSGGSVHLTLTLVLLAVGFYLMVGPELFRLIDVFNNRMNTVFKLYYQAWLLLAIVSAYGLYYLGSQRVGPSMLFRVGIYGWLGLVGLLVVASLYYAPGAALDKAGPGSQRTLDGLAFLKYSSPGEYEAIRWLREEAPRGRLVEAAERPPHFQDRRTDYTDYGRISASTGLPTIIGWQGHEQQWRGSTQPFAGRPQEVEEIYRSEDIGRVQELLEKYQVRYVYVGRRERQSYGWEGMEKFEGFMTPVFCSGDVVIYSNTGAKADCVE